NTARSSVRSSAACAAQRAPRTPCHSPQSATDRPLDVLTPFPATDPAGCSRSTSSGAAQHCVDLRSPSNQLIRLIDREVFTGLGLYFIDEGVERTAADRDQVAIEGVQRVLQLDVQAVGNALVETPKFDHLHQVLDLGLWVHWGRWRWRRRKRIRTGT